MVQMFNEMKGKRVLVTGADGFIGSHLTEMLLENGAIVRALSQYNSFNNWGWLEETKKSESLEILSGDIRDPYYCNKITKNIDIVFHLAALIAIPYSYLSPVSYLQTNIEGTLNICQAALENRVGRILHTSSSEVYGTAKYVPIDEKHPLQPQSPYSATKIGADSLALSFYYSFNLPLVIARPFNTYGPRQSARAVIPTIIVQMIKGKKNIRLGNVSPTRDFSYVEDTCRGLVLLALTDNILGETVNIGSNSDISIADTCALIKKITKSEAHITIDNKRVRPNKSEVLRLLCDNTKLKKLTGFEPKYTLEMGLKKTIDWFRDSHNLKKYKVDTYNV